MKNSIIRLNTQETKEISGGIDPIALTIGIGILGYGSMYLLIKYANQQVKKEK